MLTRRFAKKALAFVSTVALALCGLLGGATAVTAQTQTAVEYYYAAWNYYFVTSFPDEIAVLDGGAFGGVWKRTGQTFTVWSQSSGGALPTCRFFSTSFAPKSSHFYTPYAAECATVKTNPNWQYESIAFYLQLPDANGNCPAGTVILYRLYNNGMGGAPNHRFTTSATTFNQMRAAGWIFEGNGLTGAFACVPASSPPRTTAEGLWYGSTTIGANFYGIALDTGAGYFIYTWPGTNHIAGVIQGSFASANGAFSSYDSRDFYIGYGVFAVTVTGFYTPRATINGVSTEGGNSLGFSGTYQPEYDQPVNLAAVAGTFSGEVASSQGWQNAVIAVNAAGAFTGAASGCQFGGTATPHGSVNIMDLAVTFYGGACIFGTSTLYGVAYYDATSRTIFGAAPNATRTDGFLFVGTKL